MKLTATVTEVELDSKGNVIALKGKCKAIDLQKKKDGPKNVFETLGIDWVYC